MRLSFHVQGEEVVNTLEAGTLSFKRMISFETERIHALTGEMMEVLERGNRAHTLSESNLRHMREVGEQLTHLLTHPEILERLPAGDEALFLQLDESLVTGPWELLHDGQDFWCHRYDLGRLVATPQAMIGRSAPMPSSGPLRMLVICSDPQGDLPEVLVEGEALLKRLDESTTVDADLITTPTVESVRRQLKAYDILHFAGHADHDTAHPEKSGWLLADGKLTASDVMALSGGRAMPMLVFSNACRSSQTEAWKPNEHQVYGLANAFLLSGVRLYVGTQWEVIDGQSADLATAFYEALGRGAGAGMAMRVARKKVVREQGEATLSWASYVLYGDPSLAPMKPTEFRQSEVLSGSLLGLRESVPAKRAVTSDASVGAGMETRRQRSSDLRRGGPSLSGWIALGSAMVAMGALTMMVYLLLHEKKAPTPQQGTTVPQLERGRQLPANPLIALAVADEVASLRRCLQEKLAASPRFRVVSGAKEMKSVSSPQTREAALRIGQGLGAEIVVYVDGKEGEKSRLAVADVLTGDVPIHVAVAPTPAGCARLFGEMSRVLLGEGHVVAVHGTEVTVNLGWRSRVAPGTVLLLERGERPAGSLTVERVEMERCVARGQAHVGDAVRLPR